MNSSLVGKSFSYHGNKDIHTVASVSEYLPVMTPLESEVSFMHYRIDAWYTDKLIIVGCEHERAYEIEFMYAIEDVSFDPETGVLACNGVNYYA